VNLFHLVELTAPLLLWLPFRVVRANKLVLLPVSDLAALLTAVHSLPRTSFEGFSLTIPACTTTSASLKDDSANALAGMNHLRSLIVSECHRLTDAFVVRIGESEAFSGKFYYYRQWYS